MCNMRLGDKKLFGQFVIQYEFNGEKYGAAIGWEDPNGIRGGEDYTLYIETEEELKAWIKLMQGMLDYMQKEGQLNEI